MTETGNETHFPMGRRRLSRKQLNQQFVAASVLVVTVGYLLVASNVLIQHHTWKEEQKRRRTPRQISPQTSLEHAADPPIVQQRSLQRAEEISSVDYMACCGAGHRTSKLAEANYLARHILGFGLRVYWGYCDTYETRQQQTEVFHYLFGSEPLALDSNAPKLNPQQRNLFARINNDVPEFVKLIRDDRPCEDKCHMAKADADVVFYEELRKRFRNADTVQEFRHTHFRGRKVIGIHVRAGNGESGDFSDRNRNIADVSTWLQSLAVLLQKNHLPLSSDDTTSPIIFLATDTQSLVPKLQSALPKVEIVTWSQQRPGEGSGVLFGEQGKVNVEGESCLDHWTDTFTDMMLLSYADVLIAARPSSFTQGLPMSLTLAQGRSFCEVNFNATAIQCRNSFRDWCCDGVSTFSLEGIKQRYEYIRMPKPSTDHVDVHSEEDRKSFKISERPSGGVCTPRPIGWKQPCLPFDWSQHTVKPPDDSVNALSSKNGIGRTVSHPQTRRRPMR